VHLYSNYANDITKTMFVCAAQPRFSIFLLQINSFGVFFIISLMSKIKFK
jgi:hypothetical protein